MTFVLELMILLMLQFEGISGKTVHMYVRAGDQVSLPYDASSSSHSCSKVDWLYQKERNKAEKVVTSGKVDRSSAGASRLSVSSNCSLLIRNTNAEDTGLYVCSDPEFPAFIYLNILSISPSPPDVHGNVKLQCSLVGLDDEVSCQYTSIFWVDETGTQLIAEKSDSEARGKKTCVSVLTVKHQREKNKRFSCQFVRNNNVKVQAVYVPASTDPNHSNTFVIIGAAVGVVLMLLAVVTALLLKQRKSKVTEDLKNETDLQKSRHHSNDLTYVIIYHWIPKTFTKRTVKEEAEVTYSAVVVK